MRKLILIFMFVFLSSFVYASSDCVTNENCEILVVNPLENTSYINITINDENETIKDTMDYNPDQNTYVYDYIFDTDGTYLVCVESFSAENVSLNSACDYYTISSNSFSWLSDEKLEYGETPKSLHSILYIILAFCVAGYIIFLGSKRGDNFLFIFAGLIFLGLSLYLFNVFPLLAWAVFALGIYIIIMSYKGMKK